MKTFWNWLFCTMTRNVKDSQSCVLCFHNDRPLKIAKLFQYDKLHKFDNNICFWLNNFLSSLLFINQTFVVTVFDSLPFLHHLNWNNNIILINFPTDFSVKPNTWVCFVKVVNCYLNHKLTVKFYIQTKWLHFLTNSKEHESSFHINPHNALNQKKRSFSFIKLTFFFFNFSSGFSYKVSGNVNISSGKCDPFLLMT